MNIQQAQDLCKLAHADQYRRSRPVTEEEYRIYELHHNPPNFVNSKGSLIELTDKGWIISEAFYTHPFTVAKMVHNPDAKIVAYLHDLIEDTNTFIEWKEYTPYLVFNNLYYPLTIIQAEALDKITKKDNQSYNNYIKQVCTNKIASEVKLADITHNLSDSPTSVAKRKYIRSVTKLFETLLKD